MKLIESEIDYKKGILDQCKDIIDYIQRYNNVEFTTKIKLEEPIRIKYYELAKNKNIVDSEIIAFIDYYFGKYDTYKDWLSSLSDEYFCLKKSEINQLSLYVKELMDNALQQYKDYCQL